MSARGYRKEDQDFNVFSALLALTGADDDTAPHWHRCPKCKHVWTHSRAELDAQDSSLEAFDRAHSCAKCGAGNCVSKFDSEEHARTASPRFHERNRRE